MFLGSYRYEGEPSQLLPAYERLLAQLDTSAFHVHVCAADATGITVLDACPDEATFDAFSTSADFTGACAAAGLPRAVVTRLGEVHRVHAREVVPT
jgi:hypothetical protein